MINRRGLVVLLCIGLGSLCIAATNLSSKRVHTEVPNVTYDADIAGHTVRTSHIRCVADCELPVLETGHFEQRGKAGIYYKATSRPIQYAGLDWSKTTNPRYAYRMTNCESMQVNTVDLGNLR